jgi:hypothetical protein
MVVVFWLVDEQRRYGWEYPEEKSAGFAHAQGHDLQERISRGPREVLTARRS